MVFSSFSAYFNTCFKSENVSENEKKKLQRNAKKSNLNLSSYLRKSGLQKEIYSIPDEELRKIYNGIIDFIIFCIF